MIYRKLDASGDYSFGLGPGELFTDNPDAVGQAVKTRLLLIQGEWFLDVNEGTPYNSRILGMGTISQYDAALQERILNTPGVTEIMDYASGVDPRTRAAFVNCTVNTVYGQTTIQQVL